MQQLTVDGLEWDGSCPDEEAKEYTDKSGNILKFKWFEDCNVIPLYKMQCLKQIKGFKMRPDDVYLAGHPRTGTNWTHEIVSMLLKGKPETVTSLKLHLEMVPEEELEKMPSPRVINNHLWLSKAPDDLKLKKCKVVFNIRDPKDVIVSIYKVYYGYSWSDTIYRGSFEDYLDLYLKGNVDHNGIFEHWRHAENFFKENPDVPVHVVEYEYMKKNPVTSVQKLSDFLGLPRNDDLCQAIAEKCEFTRMKADKDPYTVKFDNEDILYRKGQSGDWKNFFTEKTLEDYYRVYEEKMKGSRFYDMYARKK